MINPLIEYKNIWFVDFEYQTVNEKIERVLCMVAKELNTGKTYRLWEDELLKYPSSPFDVSGKSLFVSYYAAAEINSFLHLGWPLPVKIIDLFIEFKLKTNGVYLRAGYGLVGALQYHDINCIEAVEKNAMRDLALRGGEYSEVEKEALIEYCESDVLALEKLFLSMENEIDFPRALYRGHYSKVSGQIENNGIPIDSATLKKIQENTHELKLKLIEEFDHFGIYFGTVFKESNFAAFIKEKGIPWPYTASGKLSLTDETFKLMAETDDDIANIKELRNLLSKVNLNSIKVGKDGRSRCMLSIFQSKTGRNQPSNSKFIFGASSCLRGLIKPDIGCSVAYIDWSQQEFGIAAALSGDEVMKEVYLSDDPYLSFAKSAGAVPENATKQTHKKEREKFKSCVLAVQYGMGAASLALNADIPEFEAKKLLELHKKTFKDFWSWSDNVLNFAMLRNEIFSTFGWRLQVTGTPNIRSLKNFPMQANGAEMLRIACIIGTEMGVKICAPVHDAVLIEAKTEEIEKNVKLMQEAMVTASRIVLNGFELKSSVEIFDYPERYMDERGHKVWNKIVEICGAPESKV